MATKKNKKKQTFDLKTLETTLEKYFGKQAPQLPKEVKKVIVDFGPWLLVLLVIISIPSLITALGFSFFTYPYYRMWRHSSFGIASTIIPLIVCGFSLAALPGLFKKSLKAWRLVFYASLISLVGSLFTFDLVNLIITALASWYILFQIKSSYK